MDLTGAPARTSTRAPPGPAVGKGDPGGVTAFGGRTHRGARSLTRMTIPAPVRSPRPARYPVTLSAEQVLDGSHGGGAESSVTDSDLRDFRNERRARNDAQAAWLRALGLDPENVVGGHALVDTNGGTVTVVVFRLDSAGQRIGEFWGWAQDVVDVELTASPEEFGL